MRRDTKVLLDRLGEETFKYYDFESPSLEIDVWPMFEALLLDERVVGKISFDVAGQPAVEKDEPAPPSAAPEKRTVVPDRRGRSQAMRGPARDEARTGLFGNYGAAAVADSHGESVRDMLGRLARNG